MTREGQRVARFLKRHRDLLAVLFGLKHPELASNYEPGWFVQAVKGIENDPA